MESEDKGELWLALPSHTLQFQEIPLGMTVPSGHTMC